MAAERRRGLARLGTVRVRTTVAAVVVAGLAMAVGGLALVAVLRGALTRELRTTARLRGQDVAELLAADPAGRGPLAVNEADELLIQVLDERGRVVLASPNAQGLAPVARLHPGQSAEFEIPEAAPVEADGGFLAVATGADTSLGPRTVLVSRSTEAVTEATAAVGGLLAVGLPLLLAVVAATTWVVVGRLARTMNRMLGRLEQAQVRQRRLVSDASHELRSPVAAIRQHAEVALAHPDRTTTAELAATVLAEDLRLQRLAEDLLLLTRADEHTLALHRRPVDLDDLVFDEARRLRASTGLRVDTTAVSAGRVDGDAAGLRRVLRNLGDNAARHAAGRLAFSLAETDGLVLLGVDDDGPGIPEADRRRVLERFVRLDDARARDDGGSGLGLAIVAELATAHGGTVAVAPSALGGTRVEVTLPRLAATGGGTVTETEAGDDGAAYGVGVRLPDGRQVEVNLDQSFKVVGQEPDEDRPGEDAGR